MARGRRVAAAGQPCPNLTAVSAVDGAWDARAKGDRGDKLAAFGWMDVGGVLLDGANPCKLPVGASEALRVWHGLRAGQRGGRRRTRSEPGTGRGRSRRQRGRGRVWCPFVQPGFAAGTSVLRNRSVNQCFSGIVV